MRKQPKRLFFRNKGIILFLVLFFHHIAPIYGQRDGFLFKYKNIYVASCDDIIEDSKGGYIFNVGTEHIRLSPKGEIMWMKEWGYCMKYIAIPDSNVMYSFGWGIPGWGTFELVKFDLEGNRLFHIFEDLHGYETEYVQDALYDSIRKLFVVCGSYYDMKRKYPESSDHWIAAYNLSGKKIWENKIHDSGTSRLFIRIFPNKKYHGYSLVSDDEHIRDRKEWIIVDSVGRVIKRAPVESNPAINPIHPIQGTHYNGYYDYVIPIKGNNLSVDQLNDSVIIASVSDPLEYDQVNNLYLYDQDFNIIKRIKDAGALGIVANKYGGYVGFGGPGILGFKNIDGSTYGWVGVYQNSPTEFIDIYKTKQSRDGGFYGVAVGEYYQSLDFSQHSDMAVYVFKTDSIGLIHQNRLKDANLPFKLQPNPAHNRVKVSVAYFYGDLNVKMYDVTGNLLLEKIQTDKDELDISSFTPGLYFLNATIIASGQSKTLKLQIY